MSQGIGRAMLCGGVSGLAMLMMAGGALAQQTAEPVRIEEVVVTAQKRSESLQEVPVSVAVVSGARLEQQQISSVENLPLVSPSLAFNDSNSSRGQGLSVRGVGTLSFSDGVEPSVSTVVDGVVLGRQAMSVFDLIDIDRVEILRGPQGTLFGKNASAGVLSIVSQRPSNQFGGAYGATLTDQGERKLRGTVTGPIVEDKLAARLTAYYSGYDGYVKNVTTGTELNDRKQYGVRAKLLFTPTDTLDVLAIADYAKSSGACCAPTIRSVTANNLYFGKTYASYVGVTPSKDNEQTSASVDSVNNQNSAGASIEANQQLGGFTLTSITAFRHFHVYDNIDSDLISINLLDLNNANQRQNQFTQELRITSPKGERLEYVAGLYYFFQGLKTQTQSAGTLGAVPIGTFLGSQVDRGIHTENASVFGQATFHVTDRLSLIAGGRYTTEQMNAWFRRKVLPGALAAAPASVAGGPLIAEGLKSDESKVSTKFGVQYDIAPGFMVYASYSRGFKGAALNLLNFLTAAQVSSGAYLVPPEIPTAYEAGARTSFFDRRLQLNATVFNETFKGFQATAYDSLTQSNTLTSAGELRSRGVELEALAAPARGLTLSANLAYTDAEFTDFPNAPCYPGQLLVAATNCRALGATFIQNLKGAPLNNAPKWAYTLSASYTRPLGWHDLNGFVDLNYAYRSKVNFSLNQDPNTVQKGFGVTSVNLGVQTPGRGLRLALFARNLFDEHYASFIYASSFQSGNASTPAGYSQFFGQAARRTVGVALSGKF